jgi:hypothetical protein
VLARIGGEGAGSCLEVGGECATRGGVMDGEKPGVGAWMGDSACWVPNGGGDGAVNICLGYAAI